MNAKFSRLALLIALCANFDNTPDVGVNLSVARILFGSRERRAKP